MVVVGFGGAGSIAAITAHDAGARVYLLEKMANPGGQTMLSGGGFASWTEAESLDALQHLEAMYAVSRTVIDPPMLRTFATEAHHNLSFIKAIGAQASVYGVQAFLTFPDQR